MPPGPDASLVFIILTREIDRLQHCEILCNEIIILIVHQKMFSPKLQLININKPTYYLIFTVKKLIKSLSLINPIYLIVQLYFVYNFNANLFSILRDNTWCVYVLSNIGTFFQNALFINRRSMIFETQFSFTTIYFSCIVK